MSKLLSKEAEDRLLKAARDVTSLVDDEGYKPTDAVVKVAEQYGLGPEMVKRVCEAHNAGRLTYQRETNHDILDKMASFDLASPEQAIVRLWPTNAESTIASKVAEKVSTAVDPCYSAPPAGPRPDHTKAVKIALAHPLPYTVEKTASAEPPQKSFSARYAEYCTEKKARQKLEYDYLNSRDEFQLSIQKIAGYFKQHQYNRLPYGAVAVNVPLMFGKEGSAILSYLESRHGLNQTKESADRKNPKHYCVDKTAEPYLSIEAAIKSAKATNNLMRLRDTADATIQKMAEDLGEAPVPTSAQPSRPLTVLGGQKEANWLTGMLGGSIPRAMFQQAQPASTQDLVRGYEDRLTDPDHENQLRTIRAKAMLTEFMSNDDIISGYDPNEVLNAYNAISQLAPRSSTQPAVIRPLLQKWLAQGGKIEPFEAAETANIENTITKNQNPEGVTQHGMSAK